MYVNSQLWKPEFENNFCKTLSLTNNLKLSKTTGGRQLGKGSVLFPGKLAFFLAEWPFSWRKPLCTRHTSKCWYVFVHSIHLLTSRSYCALLRACIAWKKTHARKKGSRVRESEIFVSISLSKLSNSLTCAFISDERKKLITINNDGICKNFILVLLTYFCN